MGQFTGPIGVPKSEFDDLNSDITPLLKHELGASVVLSTSDYTTLSDGYFTITIAPGLSRTVYGYINNAVVMCVWGQSGQSGYPTCGIFVKKGMRIRLSEAVANESGGLFYPLV